MIGLVGIVIPRRMAAELGFLLRTKEIPLLPLSLGCYEDHKGNVHRSASYMEKHSAMLLY